MAKKMKSKGKARSGDILAIETKSSSVEESISALLSGDGSQMSAKKALKLATSFCCARVIAEGVAQVPLKVFKRDNVSKSVSEAFDHPLWWVLHEAPNSWMSSFEFRESLSLHAVFNGAGYAVKNIVGGKVVELLPVSSDYVTTEQNEIGDVFYKIKDPSSGREDTIPQANMFVVRGPSWDGLTGIKVVDSATDALSLSASSEQAQNKLFANGARPGGLLSTEKSLDPAQIDRIKNLWQNSYSGKNAYKVALLDNGMRYTTMSMTGVDAQTLETRRFQIEEICRFFRVFPQMIMSASNSPTFASAEQFFLAHVIHTLLPWVNRWEQSIKRDLMTREEIQQGYYPKLIMEGLLRGDTKTRTEYYKTMTNIAAMNPNEVRQKEDYNPYDGGDVYRSQVNQHNAELDINPESNPDDPVLPKPTDEGN